MLAIQAGDHAAFDRIVTHYQDAVLNMVRKFLGQRAWVEDVAQEVFLRVFRARDKYRPEARFRTWLYRIVFNLCINETKQEKRRQAFSLDHVDQEHSTVMDVADETSVNPEETMARDELANKVREVVNSLPDTQRAALVLNKYEDLSYREIASVINSTEKAVKSLLARARDKVKEKLEPYLREGVS